MDTYMSGAAYYALTSSPYTTVLETFLPQSPKIPPRHIKTHILDFQRIYTSHVAGLGNTAYCVQAMYTPLPTDKEGRQQHWREIYTFISYIKETI